MAIRPAMICAMVSCVLIVGASLLASQPQVPNQPAITTSDFVSWLRERLPKTGSVQARFEVESASSAGIRDIGYDFASEACYSGTGSFWHLRKHDGEVFWTPNMTGEPKSAGKQPATFNSSPLSFYMPSLALRDVVRRPEIVQSVQAGSGDVQFVVVCRFHESPEVAAARGKVLVSDVGFDVDSLARVTRVFTLAQDGAPARSSQIEYGDDAASKLGMPTRVENWVRRSASTATRLADEKLTLEAMSRQHSTLRIDTDRRLAEIREAALNTQAASPVAQDGPASAPSQTAIPGWRTPVLITGAILIAIGAFSWWKKRRS